MLKDKSGETIPADHYIPQKAKDGRFYLTYPAVGTNEELLILTRADLEWERNSVMFEIPVK
ncbi:hypothetical protein [Paenibacillus dakarensis]|uniref:hypothetical protein n=1 Tax=Paenibacillus dakarensis TaxID=1527293 RepID=UPI0006D5AC59|nr:hypothetical protein [Paenibacillus dakarensis]